jgi:hypothetical protein
MVQTCLTIIGFILIIQLTDLILHYRKKQTSSKSSSIPRNWPQLWDGDMVSDMLLAVNAAE